MNPRGRSHCIAPLALALVAMALSGCVSPAAEPGGAFAVPVAGVPAAPRQTSDTNIASCPRIFIPKRKIRLAMLDLPAVAPKSAGGNLVTDTHGIGACGQVLADAARKPARVSRQNLRS